MNHYDFTWWQIILMGLSMLRALGEVIDWCRYEVWYLKNHGRYIGVNNDPEEPVKIERGNITWTYLPDYVETALIDTRTGKIWKK